MTVRDILGFIFLPLLLFIVGGALRTSGLPFGERGLFLGIGELCVLSAIALLIVGATCLACQLPAGELPALGVFLIVLASIVVAATGLFLDLMGGGAGKKTISDEELLGHFKTMFQFSVVLLGAFIVPRMGRKPHVPELVPPPRYERD